MDDGRVKRKATNLDSALHIFEVDEGVVDVATQVLGHAFVWPTINPGVDGNKENSDEGLVVGCMGLVDDQVGADLEAPGLEAGA